MASADLQRAPHPFSAAAAFLKRALLLQVLHTLLRLAKSAHDELALVHQQTSIPLKRRRENPSSRLWCSDTSPIYPYQTKTSEDYILQSQLVLDTLACSRVIS